MQEEDEDEAEGGEAQQLIHGTRSFGTHFSCTLLRMNAPKKKRRAGSVLVLKETEVCTPTGCGIVDQILLVRKPRPSDAWQLPQGGIEERETCEQAALRELVEETGLRPDAVIHSSSETYCYDFPPDFIARNHPVNDGQTLCFVAARVRRDAVVQVDHHEIDQSVWVLPEQLPQYIKRREYLEVIGKVLEEVRKISR